MLDILEHTPLVCYTSHNTELWPGARGMRQKSLL